MAHWETFKVVWIHTHKQKRKAVIKKKDLWQFWSKINFKIHIIWLLSRWQVESIPLWLLLQYIAGLHMHSSLSLSEARYSTLDWRSSNANQLNCVNASQRKSVGVWVCVYDWLWLACPQFFNKRLKTPFVDTRVSCFFPWSVYMMVDKRSGWYENKLIIII